MMLRVPITLRYIPGLLGLLGPMAASATSHQPNASQYLSDLYLWFLGFVGIAALFGIVVGGVLYMFSDSLSSTAQAKAWIWRSIGGIVLAATSYLLLYTISPDLVQGFDFTKIITNAIQNACTPPPCF